jgi:RNase P subunit RPR2
MEIAQHPAYLYCFAALAEERAQTAGGRRERTTTMVSKAKRAETEFARKDIERLFSLAEATTEQRLADRYVALARKAASRHRVSLKRYNRVHCRKCSCAFTGATLRVRTKTGPAGKNVMYECLRCGHITRIPLQKREG